MNKEKELARILCEWNCRKLSPEEACYKLWKLYEEECLKTWNDPLEKLIVSSHEEASGADKWDTARP